MMVGSEVKTVGARAGRRHRQGAQRTARASAACRRKPADAVLDAAEEHLARMCVPARCIGIAGVAGNGQGEFFEAVSGEALQAGRRRRAHPRQGSAGRAVDIRPAAARRGLRAGGAARPWRGAAHEAFGKPAAVAPCHRRQGLRRRRRHGQDRRGRRGRAAHHRGDGRAQERAAIRKRQRCPAAICRNSSSAANSTAARRDGRQPADLGRRRGRCRAASARRWSNSRAAARRCW